MPAALPRALTDSWRAARHAVVLCGSGVSAESGVPTFRDAQTGMWASFRPEDLATPEAFQRNPSQVWDWYAWRRELCDRIEPNAGHLALARLASAMPRLTLLTQNVDGLHQRAGSPEVLEIHGNIHRNLCFAEGTPVSDADMIAGRPPTCVRCGSLVRPAVVWFGEAIDSDMLDRALEACRDCDVFISAGTSSEVYPAAGFGRIAADTGAVLVEVNPDETPLTPICDYVLRGQSATLLPALVAAYISDEERQ